MPDAVMTQPERVTVPVQQRQLQLRSETWNQEALTIDVVWSTGARRRTFDWSRWAEVDEELDLGEGRVRLERLNMGAPVLDTHSAETVRDQIGVVVPGSARIENGQGVATVQLSDRDSVKDIARDIARGIVRNLSVGYQVHEYEITERDGARPLYRAVDWEPFEISFVPMPADAGAQTRKDDARQGGNPCIIRRADTPANPEAIMDPKTTEAPAPAPVVEAPAAAPAQETRSAPAPQSPSLSATTVVAKARAAGLDADAVAQLQDLHADGQLRDETALFAEIGRRFAAQDRGAPQRNVNTQPGRVTVDESEKVRDAITSAIMHRYQPSQNKLEHGAEEFRNLKLIDMARLCLQRAGANTNRMSDMQIAADALGLNTRASHSTSDFPLILENVSNKTLLSGYESAPRTFQAFCDQATMRDYKLSSFVQMGDAPELLEVNENGEYVSGTISESAEKFALKKYGRKVSITREVIINDDLGAFLDLPVAFGQRAAEKESDLVWGIVTGNPLMSDGVALFAAGHGNLASSGGAISSTTITAGRTAMMKQTGLDGRKLNLRPAVLWCGPENFEAAQKAVSAVLATTTGEVNIYAGQLRVVEDSRVPGKMWGLATLPTACPTIKYAYMDGQMGPFIESRTNFDTDGIEMKVRHDFGAKAMDWRGLYRNPGA